MPELGLLEIRKGVLNWVASQRMGGRSTEYRFTKSSGPTLLSTCFAVLTMELFDYIRNLTAEERSTFALNIRSCEDKTTGLFIDPQLRKEDLLKPDAHSWDYLSIQFTKFAVMALDALGEQITQRFEFLEPYRDAKYLIRWLEERNWKNPWLESNNIMFVGCLLLYEYIKIKDSKALEMVYKLLDWHDRYQDPKTGFWGTNQGASLANAMAGAYHIYLIYHYLKRPIRYKEKIIDSTLSLQQKDGLFVAEGGGGSCEDLDAIDILVKLTIVTDYRKEDIKQALLKSLQVLMLGQNKDGGFSWKIKTKKGLIGKFKDFNRTAYYSDWTKMPFRLYRSDMWSTWFRPLATALIVTAYPEDFGDDVKFRFRRLPGLGWHF